MGPILFFGKCLFVLSKCFLDIFKNFRPNVTIPVDFLDHNLHLNTYADRRQLFRYLSIRNNVLISTVRHYIFVKKHFPLSIFPQDHKVLQRRKKRYNFNIQNKRAQYCILCYYYSTIKTTNSPHRYLLKFYKNVTRMIVICCKCYKQSVCYNL